ncbi:MAG: hypothetical protein KGZ60_09215 [Truepera sp.]|nr:hypothetical protein [Truepera sp.]
MNRTERIGAMLLAIGLGLLLARALPGVAAWWPLGLVVAGFLLWRGVALQLVTTTLIALSLTLAVAGPGLHWLAGWMAASDRGQVVATHQSSPSMAREWAEVELLRVVNAVGDIQIAGDASEPSVSITYRRQQAGGRVPGELQARYDATTRTLTVIGLDPAAPERDRRGLSAVITIAVPSQVAVQVENQVGKVTIARVAAAAVSNHTGEVQVRRIVGAVTATNDRGAIRIEDAYGPVSASTRVGDVRLSFDQPVNHSIAARTDVGSVTLLIPTASNVEIRATSRTRNLSGDLQTVIATEGRLRLGVGENIVELAANEGGIEVRKR